MKKIACLSFLLSGILLFSCSSDYPGYKQTDSGLYYKFYTVNEDGQKPVEGDVLTVMMMYRTEDSVLFNSKDLPDAFRFPLDPPGFKGDIFEGLAMMHVGDSATFIIPADSLKRYGNLPPLDTATMLYFDVKLLSIQAKADFEKDQEKLKQQELEEQEKMKAQEAEDIAKFIKDKNIRVKPSASGLYYIPEKNGNGTKALTGKVVEVHYTAEFLNGQKLFSSHDEGGESINFQLGKGFEIPAIEEALQNMKAGGRARLVVPSELAYGQKGIKDMVPPYSPLVFNLELLSVIDTAAFKVKMMKKEKESIAAYLKENNITAKSDESGLYYVELKKGNGSMAIPGKTLRVNYTGKFLNGKVFDSSEEAGGPVEFQLGAGEAIPGWEIGLSYMCAGGRAKLIVPSKLAYGNNYTGNIPPYTPLVYEIELLSVK
jgi:FKBP-type peptidyl-prolyl cis-trans isomerase